MDVQNVEPEEAKSVGRDASPSTAPRGSDKSPARRRSSLSAIRSPKEPTSKPERFAWAADDASDEPDSDADTVVLPGKDGYSPSKVRKVRQEDKSDGETDAPAKKGAGDVSAEIDRTLIDGKNWTDGAENDSHAKRPSDSKPSAPAVLKKKPVSGDKDRHSRIKDTSSGLSSAPTSPSQRRRRRSNDSVHSSDSEASQTKKRHALKPSERPLSHKRKALKADSDDDEHRKARRQRTTSAGLEGSRISKESRPSSKQHGNRDRSASPHPRTHRRSASTQLSTQTSNGFGKKLKRIPPPLQAPDEFSDDSSASGSPHPRSSKFRSLATPSIAESNMSPAKMAPPKKHLDAHGQTLLARACARGDYEAAKHRLGERPEDLNVADYAGNTPLQIAAINGREDIVKLLLDAGCNLDCVNYDKDTPLLDAVDNGHLGVVKMLLGAGVNPRKANVNGEEPIDRVTEDTDNGTEIRDALVQARKNIGERRRTSEDRQSQHDSADARDSRPLDSPRRTTASLPGRRSGTVRSTKTRNDLLYISLDEKSLREAAACGDHQKVAHILQVRDQTDDPEAMVAAARGGHEPVMQLLLGLGGANPDPLAVPTLAPEFATPILAAIGQENIKVLELLLEQQGFDPTRRVKGEAYYEIARRRQGTNWKEEEHLLQNAYDDFKRRKDGKSPGRREEKRSRRDDGEHRAHRRAGSSPGRDEGSRRTSAKLNSPKEKRRSGSHLASGDDNLSHTNKKLLGRKRDDKSSASHPSDREISPTLSHKATKSKRADIDLAGQSSEGETAKPRRKLISKGELRGEKRRSSMTSTAPSLKEPSSPTESRNEDTERHKPPQKHLDRTKSLKRDESKDRVSYGDGSSKRHRVSLTPDRPSNGEKDDEGPAKRRRLEDSNQDKRTKRPSSSDGKSSKLHREGSNKPSSKSNDLTTVDPKPRIKLEEADVEMPDAAQPKLTSEEQQARYAEDKKRAEAEEKRHEEEEAARREGEEAKRRKEEEELEAQRKREAEEAEKTRKAERKRAEEERKEKEEEEKQRKEEEALRQKQLEEEAAEELRRKREREAREEQERLDRERAFREEVERKRTVREAEQRRIREEAERARLDKLPPLLQWFDLCPNPKTPQIADLFKRIQGARYDTIRPDFNRTPEGRELWLLSAHVALLLGEKDLTLSRYTAWERVPAGRLGKLTLWRLEQDMYTCIAPKFREIGRQLPGWKDPATTRPGPDDWSNQRRAAWEKFQRMDMFWVKASDFLYTVPQIPHLRGIQIAVEYRELIESDHMAMKYVSLQKWRQDPNMERFGDFCPRATYYINGRFTGEDLPQRVRTSKTPFPDRRVPRRGLVAVSPEDSDYDRLCEEQGLHHLIRDNSSTAPSKDAQPSSPERNGNGIAKPLLNGHPSPGESVQGAVPNGINGSG